jgi:hypothetical protein
VPKGDTVVPQLSKSAENILEKRLGVKFDDFMSLDDTKQTAKVEQSINKKLGFPESQDIRKMGRGNPLLTMERIRTIEEIDNRINEIVS